MQTLPNTLFNRAQALNIKLNKFQTKALGQVIRIAYQDQRKELPSKIAVNISPKKALTVKIRLVACYPDDFGSIMDKLIKEYSKNQQKAVAYYKSKPKQL